MERKTQQGAETKGPQKLDGYNYSAPSCPSPNTPQGTVDKIDAIHAGTGGSRTTFVGGTDKKLPNPSVK